MTYFWKRVVGFLAACREAHDRFACRVFNDFVLKKRQRLLLLSFLVVLKELMREKVLKIQKIT